MKISFLIASLALLAMSTVLSGQEITVTSPTAGDEWRSGTTHSITWTTSGIMPNRVTVSLRNAGSRRRDPDVLVIAADTENDGNVSWPIPGTLAAGEYFIRVRTISPDPQAVVIGESAIFRITLGIATIPMVPFQPHCDLELAGVGVEYYRDNIVAWVKNNGPNAINQDVKFRLNFPELGGGEQIITRRLTIPVGEERRVDLQPLAASAIPVAGLRTSVSIDTSLSGITDANRLNQHRDVRLCVLDLRCDMDGLQLSKVYSYIYRNLPFKVKFALHVRHNLPRAISNIRVKYEVHGPAGPLTGAGSSGAYTIATLGSGASWTKNEEIRFGDAGDADDSEPKIRPGTTYRIVASIDDPGNAFCDVAPSNDTSELTFRFPD
jgi:hypothetical protein